MVCVMGIDIGSAYSKGIVLCGDKLESSYMVSSGGNYRQAAGRVKEELFSRSNLSSKDIAYTIATGYGAQSVAFADDRITDISCHSRGIFYLFPCTGRKY